KFQIQYPTRYVTRRGQTLTVLLLKGLKNQWWSCLHLDYISCHFGEKIKFAQITLICFECSIEDDLRSKQAKILRKTLILTPI
ncbi:hypothetical protein, partial [Bartonella sp. CL32QHWL-1]|uniref:hypothetical protein n=1 Tax=Bartonella sp. CL32QHWL-1 TaxID=3243524 RepID=UPI0035CF39F7